MLAQNSTQNAVARSVFNTDPHMVESRIAAERRIEEIGKSVAEASARIERIAKEAGLRG